MSDIGSVIMSKPRIFWFKPLKLWMFDIEPCATIDRDLLKKASEFCKKLNGEQNDCK